MFEDIELGGEFFRSLTAIDTAITARVAAAGCRFCGGRLYRGDTSGSRAAVSWQRQRRHFVGASASAAVARAAANAPRPRRCDSSAAESMSARRFSWQASSRSPLRPPAPRDA